MSHAWAVAKRSGQEGSVLPFSPHHLTALDMVFVFALILVKYIYYALGQLPQWQKRGDQFRLPPISISAPLRVEENDKTRYKQAVGHDENGFILVGLTTPLMLLLVTNSRSPLLPVGCVNTKNRYEFIDSKNLVGRQLQVNASFGRIARKVKRGIEVDIIVNVLEGDRPIFRQVITILQFMKHKEPPREVQDDPLEEAMSSFGANATPSDKFIIDVGAPRRWAGICLDYNPIHISSLAAKLFGFSSRIAHGNYVVAAYLAQRSTAKGAVVEVAFKRPMMVPTELQAQEGRREKDHWLFQLVKGDKVHVIGSVKGE